MILIMISACLSFRVLFFWADLADLGLLRLCDRRSVWVSAVVFLFPPSGHQLVVFLGLGHDLVGDGAAVHPEFAHLAVRVMSSALPVRPVDFGQRVLHAASPAHLVTVLIAPVECVLLPLQRHLGVLEGRLEVRSDQAPQLGQLVLLVGEKAPQAAHLIDGGIHGLFADLALPIPSRPDSRTTRSARSSASTTTPAPAARTSGSSRTSWPTGPTGRSSRCPEGPSSGWHCAAHCGSGSTGAASRSRTSASSPMSATR